MLSGGGGGGGGPGPSWQDCGRRGGGDETIELRAVEKRQKAGWGEKNEERDPACDGE